MTIPRIGHTEGGHSFKGGDPSDSSNWIKVGLAEDGFKFSGGDPASKDNWEPIIDNETEASLGFANRAQYSLEPIQSNRKAFLEQEFGQENIMEDKNGELYLKQNGSFLPLNKGGVSMADIADIAGATPEIAGNVVGGLGGLIAGPAGVVAGSAAGGAVGSGFRQAVSAGLTNTPQVATPRERAIETGTSAAFSGLAGGLGYAAKQAIKNYGPGLKSFLKNIGSQAGEEITETAAESVGKSELNAGLELVPEYKPKTQETIFENVSDESGRDVVKEEAKKLGEIAKNQGIPKPTYAQSAQGKAIMAESELIDTPVFGRNARKYSDSQTTAIRKNLQKEVGDFLSNTNDDYEAGVAIRETANEYVKQNKKIATVLYDNVEENGANAMIGKRTLFNKYRDTAGDLGLIDPLGKKTPYAADSGFTRSEFEKLQSVIFDGIDALKKNPSQKIRFQDANALRKTIKAYAEEMRDSNPNAARFVTKFGKELDETMDGILNREVPGLGKVFNAANKKYYEFKQLEEKFDDFFKAGVNDEQIIKKMMGGTNNVATMKDLIGEEAVRDAAKSHVRSMIAKLGDAGVGRASSVLKDLRNSTKGAPIKMALGEKAYQNLVENIYFLDRTMQPLTVSRQSLLKMVFEKPAELKSMAGKLVGVGKSYVESKGVNVKNAPGKVFETTSKIVPTSNKNLSSLGNILGDNSQRSMSTYPAKASASISEKEKEIEKRKRAISGNKNGKN